MSGMNELYKAYDDAIELASKFEENFVELGRRLRLLQDNNQNLFKGVCAKTGLDLRKDYYLVSMARQIDKLPIPDEQLIAIGWTKASAIGMYLTKANWKELIKLAEQHTVRDLKIIMSGGKPIPNARCVLLYFKPRQYDLFAKAVLQHGGQASGSGLTNTVPALMKIIEKAMAK